MMSEDNLVALVKSVASSIPEDGSRLDTLTYSNGIQVVINSEYDPMGPHPPESLGLSEYGLAPLIPSVPKNRYVLTSATDLQPGHIVFALEEIEVSGWTSRGEYRVAIPKGTGFQVKQSYGAGSKVTKNLEATITVSGLDHLYIPVSKLGVEVANDLNVN